MDTNQTLGEYITRRNLLKFGICSGFMACFSCNLWTSGCRRGQDIRPNIILITLDTTRTDHLSCYGYHRRTSPNLDQLSRESVLYTRAIAPSSWTLPSHASLFTGKLTTSHGARYDPEGPICLADALKGLEGAQQYRVRGISQNELMLARILKQNGYKTGAVVGGPWLKKVFGLHQGFDYYDDSQIDSLNGRVARLVTYQAVKWIEKSCNKKFFLFLNYFDPHAPYSAPKGFAKTFFPKGKKNIEKMREEELKNFLYDGEILYMDFYIGRLLKKLKELDLYDSTWIIVTADHGELLGEHGEFGHGQFLTQPELHVPLLMKYPRGEMSPNRIDVHVQLTDILPTICVRLEIPVPDNLQGSALPRIRHPIVAETYPLPINSKAGDFQALYEGNYKFIWNSKGHNMLYNLKDDPAENINLAGSDYQRARKMMNHLTRYLASLPTPAPATAVQKVDNATQEALKSLGYLE